MQFAVSRSGSVGIAIALREYKKHFVLLRIGRGSAVPWPPRSPDFNPLDFFFWGYLKVRVRRTGGGGASKLVARIHGVVATISRDMLRGMQANVRQRAEVCLMMGGSHIEPFLETLRG
ncbi:hypothetical protein WH47_02070 [Habropoda laboriosa]|uniref:Uncharacterized protein n=1 Tax=Habropoda laboriosa TaxID=597456 RepID=A0A0L7QJR7_9HYME|nr:hypothetical protein WH47_02070 [Habropoda laboriosa]